MSWLHRGFWAALAAGLVAASWRHLGGWGAVGGCRPGCRWGVDGLSMGAGIGVRLGIVGRVLGCGGIGTGAGGEAWGMMGVGGIGAGVHAWGGAGGCAGVRSRGCVPGGACPGAR